MKSYLVLSDSSIWEGRVFGASIATEGEVVFTTGMVGYPESLTDPSYEGQIVVTTYPIIGNYGVPSQTKMQGIPAFFESTRIHAQALVVSTHIDSYSHWSAVQSLDRWLKEEKIPGLFGIDTRALTKRLREKGVMRGVISNTSKIPKKFHDPNKENLVARASIHTSITYGKGHTTVILVDCGVKHGIIFQLLNLGVRILRVPWNFDITRYREKYNAVIISNGPGDPTMVPETKTLAQYCLARDIPTLGICLGNQILALAAGGKTYKLLYGHRSHNQPSLDRFSNRAYMTTQNHGFAVDIASLGSQWDEWFVNINDGTNEGLKHKRKPFWSTQFHPEGRPGPFDTSWVFKEFLQRVEKNEH